MQEPAEADELEEAEEAANRRMDMTSRDTGPALDIALEWDARMKAACAAVNTSCMLLFVLHACACMMAHD